MKNDVRGFWSLLTVAKILFGIFAVIIFAVIIMLMNAPPGSAPLVAKSNIQSSNLAPITEIPTAQTPAPPEPVVRPLPKRIRIPVLKIDTEIESVGLTASGAMGVPTKPSTTAWYNGGPRPGENGNAVIAGHNGWVNGVPAVFDGLRKIKIGDPIYVDDVTGQTITFVVRELRSFTLKEDAAIVFQAPDSIAHLNLITCEGTWDKRLQSYPKRLVVFADVLSPNLFN